MTRPCRLMSSTLTSLSMSMEATSSDAASNSILMDSTVQASKENSSDFCLENILGSQMFNNLYANVYQKNTNETVSDDDESDDSFAASFSECMHKLNVYASRDCRALLKHTSRSNGGLFRVILLRNMQEKDDVYIFLIMAKDYTQVCNEINSSCLTSTRIRNDEVYLWWR